MKFGCGSCRIFGKIDTDNDGSLERNEVRIALAVSELNHLLPEGVLTNFMKDFDKDRSNSISLNEFKEGLVKWCKDIKRKNGLRGGELVVSVPGFLNRRMKPLIHVFPLIKVFVDTSYAYQINCRSRQYRTFVSRSKDPIICVHPHHS
jgi:hypothetical protein